MTEKPVLHIFGPVKMLRLNYIWQPFCNSQRLAA